MKSDIGERENTRKTGRDKEERGRGDGEKVRNTEAEGEKGPHLRTVSAVRSRVRGERSRGRPFHSQLIWGGGFPAARHSRVTTLSCATCTSRGEPTSPEIEGGTKTGRKWPGSIPGH